MTHEFDHHKDNEFLREWSTRYCNLHFVYHLTRWIMYDTHSIWNLTCFILVRSFVIAFGGVILDFDTLEAVPTSRSQLQPLLSCDFWEAPLFILLIFRISFCKIYYFGQLVAVIETPIGKEGMLFFSPAVLKFLKLLNSRELNFLLWHCLACREGIPVQLAHDGLRIPVDLWWGKVPQIYGVMCSTCAMQLYFLWFGFLIRSLHYTYS